MAVKFGEEKRHAAAQVDASALGLTPNEAAARGAIAAYSGSADRRGTLREQLGEAWAAVEEAIGLTVETAQRIEGEWIEWIEGEVDAIEREEVTPSPSLSYVADRLQARSRLLTKMLVALRDRL